MTQEILRAPVPLKTSLNTAKDWGELDKNL